MLRTTFRFARQKAARSLPSALAAPAVLATLALFAALPAAGQDVTLWPADGGATIGAPVELVVAGEIPGRQVLGLSDFRLVGSVLRAELYSLPANGTTEPFAVSAFAPELSAGLQDFVVTLDGSSTPVVEGAFRVGDREPLSLAVPPVTTVDDFARTVTVTGVAPCPSASVDVDPLRMRLTVDFEGGCVITPPPLPQPFVLEVPLPFALEPGTWTVDLIESRELRHAVATLEVVAEPAVVQNEEFEITIDWTDFAGNQGQGSLVRAPSSDSALFSFFAPDNWEVMVKVLDGCGINGHYWVYAAATTDVAYVLKVERRSTGETYVIENPLGTASPAVTDIDAFPCTGGAS